MPEGEENPRLKGIDHIDLPELESGEHLIQHLVSAGYVKQGFNGPERLCWPSIHAWLSATGTELTAWEAETLFMLSGVYAGMYAKAKSPDCPNPALGLDEDLMNVEQKKVDDFFEGL